MNGGKTWFCQRVCHVVSNLSSDTGCFLSFTRVLLESFSGSATCGWYNALQQTIVPPPQWRAGETHAFYIQASCRRVVTCSSTPSSTPT